jgi:putative hemolysin
VLSATASTADAATDPIRLALQSSLSRQSRAVAWASRPFLSNLLRVPEYSRLFERSRTSPGSTFSARALHALDIHIDLAEGSEPRVPADGPLIVAANHPHGMVDGLALVDIVSRSRPDVRVLTNDLLSSVPELAEFCVFVDAFGRTTGSTRAGLRASLRWLEQGHALVVFPSGAVAHEQWATSHTPSDGPWRDTVARLAFRSRALVVPAHIAGRNSDWFYRAGRVHAGVRTLLLARELLAKRGRRIAVRLGQPLALARHEAGARLAANVTALLRAHVERLGHPPEAASAPTVVPAPHHTLAAEVEKLGPAARLIQSGRFEVYCAEAHDIPELLREIGRLREVTFRAVGEGTGRAVDLDRFDRHYLHLFVWDREAQAVAGAYRLGAVDRVIASAGIDGLYTSTLYRYDHRLLTRLGPAIELGRSFVRAEYQRSSNALLLLWKGIARFVLRSGKYRVLFGPVSISARYSDRSRQLLQTFLEQNARHRELADLVAASAPPPQPRTEIEAASDVHALDALIAGEEADRKGIPVLLRQYLRLNAKLLAFNVDHEFNDALDALMVVDLTQVDRTILARYFGADGANRFRPVAARPAAA